LAGNPLDTRSTVLDAACSGGRFRARGGRLGGGSRGLFGPLRCRRPGREPPSCKSNRKQRRRGQQRETPQVAEASSLGKANGPFPLRAGVDSRAAQGANSGV